MFAFEDVDIIVMLILIGIAMGAISASIISAISTYKSLHKIEAAKRGMEEIRVIVDGKLTTVVARVEQLTGALEGSDTAVPPEIDEHNTASAVAEMAIDTIKESKED